MNLTKGRGVDTAIEAVGVPATFELCEAIVDPWAGILPTLVCMVKAVTLHMETGG